MDLANIGITSQKAKQFESRGIRTVEDLLAYLPTKYNDFRFFTGILPEDQISVLKVVVTSVRSFESHVTAECTEVGTWTNMKLIWFGSQWMASVARLQIKNVVVVVGKVKYDPKYGYEIVQPEVFDPAPDANRIYPIYKNIRGMSSTYLTGKLAAALDVGADSSEILPDDVLDAACVVPMPQALRYIHTPETPGEIEKGRARILFNDLLYFAVQNELNKNEVSAGSQYNIKSWGLVRKIEEALPFKLTTDQSSIVQDMLENAAAGKRINALLQADVGAGKTVLSALVAAAVIDSGYQAVLMAPTQVLAQQHLETISAMFEPHGIKVAYVDGKLKGKERKTVLGQIKSGEVQMIIGTHACFGKDVEYGKLALVVVDEEHRFGVKQRTSIVKKAAAGVHSITMSATPIPRSLAQVIYGEQIQLYTIHTMPNGRKPVITGIATEQSRVYGYVLGEVRRGHQVYVVCPMIEKSDKVQNVKSVQDVSAEYKAALEPYGVRIATLTGKDKKEDLEKTLEGFKSGAIDILVATTVIEVGVNVPNATVMVIPNAERFGLSTLHQLRGRVGRSDLQSCCVLQCEDAGEKSMERLKVLCETTDGFKIAEADLAQRGAGDLLGTQQTGDNKYISLMLENQEEYKKAVQIAKDLIRRGMDSCKFTQTIQKEREGSEADDDT